MSNEDEVIAELERLKKEKVVSEQTAQIYLSDFKKRQKDATTAPEEQSKE